jgi:hypothetical protein
MSAKSEVEAMLEAGKQSKPSGEDTYFPKFRTIRRSTGDELDPTTTFTLLPGKDIHAAKALRTYVDSVRETMPGLAKALEKAFPVLVDMRLLDIK